MGPDLHLKEAKLNFICSLYSCFTETIKYVTMVKGGGPWLAPGRGQTEFHLQPIFMIYWNPEQTKNVNQLPILFICAAACLSETWVHENNTFMVQVYGLKISLGNSDNIASTYIAIPVDQLMYPRILAALHHSALCCCTEISSKLRKFSICSWYC